MRLWDGNWRDMFPGWKYWWRLRLYSSNGIKLHSVQFQIICWLFYSSNDNNVILQSMQYQFLQNYSRIKDPSCKKIYIDKINLMLSNNLISREVHWQKEQDLILRTTEATSNTQRRPIISLATSPVWRVMLILMVNKNICHNHHNLFYIYSVKKTFQSRSSIWIK